MNLGSFIIIMIIHNYDYHPYSSIIMIIIHSESWSMAGTCLDATAATGKSPCAWSPIRGTTSPWDDGGGGGLSFFSGDPMWIMWLWLKIGCFKTPQLIYIYICYICSDSVFRQTHSRDFWFKKVIRGLAVWADSIERCPVKFLWAMEAAPVERHEQLAPRPGADTWNYWTNAWTNKLVILGIETLPFWMSICLIYLVNPKPTGKVDAFVRKVTTSVHGWLGNPHCLIHIYIYMFFCNPPPRPTIFTHFACSWHIVL